MLMRRRPSFTIEDPVAEVSRQHELTAQPVPGERQPLEIAQSAHPCGYEA